MTTRTLQQRREDLIARMKDPKTTAGVLENGVSWFLRNNRRPESKVFVCLVVKTGSAYEQSGNYGIAHYIEHMLFNGTKSYEGETLIEELQHLGVGFGHDLNAYTSLDHTVYHLEIERSSANVKKALHILSEFAFEARLEEKHIEKERPIILEEKRLRSGKGEKYIRLLLSSLFRGTPYERLVIGTEEDIRSVSRKDFTAFYEQWYHPSNLAVIVVGDIDVQEVQQDISQLFSHPKEEVVPALADPLDAIQHFAPSQEYHLYTHEESTTGSIQFFTTRRGLRGKHLDEDHRDWMQYVVSDILAERCQTYITDNVTPLSQTQCDYMGEYTRKHDMLAFGATFEPTHLEVATRFLATELERMRRFGPTEEEVRRVCANLQQRLEQRITEEDTTTHWTYVQKIMSAFLLDDDIGLPEEDLRLLQEYASTTTLETLTQVARELFAPEHFVCIVELPPAQAKADVLQDVEKWVQESAEDSTITPFVVELETEQIDRFPETTTSIESIKLPAPLDMMKVNLSNGVSGHIKQTDFQKDRFMIRILFEGGDMYLPREKQGMTEFLLKYMIDGGSMYRSASKMHRILQEKSLSLQLEEEQPSSIALYGSCKTADAPLLLELAHDLLFTPQWSDVGWQHAQQYLSLSLEESYANPLALMNEQHMRTLLAGHPSGFLPRQEDIDKWTKDDIQEYYKATFHASNMHIVTVSSLSTDKSSLLLERYFGGVHKGNKPNYAQEKVDVAFVENDVLHTLHAANDDKASVRISSPGVSFLDTDRHYYSLTADILSDRLRKAVREDMGNTYSIYARHMGYQCLKGGNFSIRFGTSPAEEERARARVLQELQQLPQGVTEDELRRALAPRRTQFTAHLKENGFWLQSIIDPWNNIPETYMFDAYTKMQETTAEELNTFLREKFRTEPLVTTVLLPKQ